MKLSIGGPVFAGIYDARYMLYFEKCHCACIANVNVSGDLSSKGKREENVRCLGCRAEWFNTKAYHVLVWCLSRHTKVNIVVCQGMKVLSPDIDG